MKERTKHVRLARDDRERMTHRASPVMLAIDGRAIVKESSMLVRLARDSTVGRQ